jgi:hypothetical protein
MENLREGDYLGDLSVDGKMLYDRLNQMGMVFTAYD